MVIVRGRLLLAWAVLAASIATPAAGLQACAEVIADIRVHGNHISTDAEVRELAGVAIGAPFEPDTIAIVTRRLRAAGRFDDVEVLKRYASIADPARILLVIIVNEGPVRVEMPGEDEPDQEPRIVRRRLFRNLLWLPVLRGEDGYGFTYGVRVAHVGLTGERGRLSFPLTWGGRRQAGIEFSRTFVGGPISRAEAGAALTRERNPGFDEHDSRRRLWGRIDHVTGPFRAGATAGWQRVSFGELDDDVRTAGADVAFDTRLNPVMPRDAVFLQAQWERADLSSTGVVHRTRLDGRGYLGLAGQSVLAVRALREGANRSVPPYLRSLLGGWSNLRGFEAGSFTGDMLVAGSAEWLVPVTSPLHAGQLGLSVFVDAGTAYEHGQDLRDQRWRTGYGGSVWVTFTAFRMSLAVAHGRGGKTRVHFGGGFEF